MPSFLLVCRQSQYSGVQFRKKDLFYIGGVVWIDGFSVHQGAADLAII